jgi:NAD(P)-dependent dehydrogenase (short-subunit alcohol dehydrogenase family)
MKSKICIVTGANAGIGKITARGLAKMGATVVMVCRNKERGEDTLNQIKRETGNPSVCLLLADLSSQSSIRKLAADFKTHYAALHVLINNAAIVPARRMITEDGLEIQFAVNYLAPFLLTSLLLGVLVKSTPARIVNVSASYHKESLPINFDDLQSEREPYDSRKVYASTKLATIMFTYELARRLQGTGVTANCLHPGVIETKLMQDFMGGASPLSQERMAVIKKLTVDLEEGARTSLYLATSPEIEGVSGKYFDNRQAVSSSNASYDEIAAKKLWELSERITATPWRGPS